mgnify:CR=1 FL=1
MVGSDLLSDVGLLGFFLPLTNDDPEFEPAKAAWARAKHKEVAAVNRRKLADDYVRPCQIYFVCCASFSSPLSDITLCGDCHDCSHCSANFKRSAGSKKTSDICAKDRLQRRPRSAEKTRKKGRSRKQKKNERSSRNTIGKLPVAKLLAMTTMMATLTATTRRVTIGSCKASQLSRLTKEFQLS